MPMTTNNTPNYGDLFWRRRRRQESVRHLLRFLFWILFPITTVTLSQLWPLTYWTIVTTVFLCGGLYFLLRALWRATRHPL